MVCAIRVASGAVVRSDEKRRARLNIIASIPCASVPGEKAKLPKRHLSAKASRQLTRKFIPEPH